MNQEQLKIMKNKDGFIAALDQSGGSTPKALDAYGVGEAEYSSNDEMFTLVHDMRTRILTSPSFTSDKIIGVILPRMRIRKPTILIVGCIMVYASFF